MEENKIVNDIVLVYSGLGVPYFLRESDTSCMDGIDPRMWKPHELRKIAEYMEENPKCSLCLDGSGKEVEINPTPNNK